MYYKIKVQPTVAKSSTKAEFVAAVYVGKAYKYIVYILRHLGFDIDIPTIFYCDNMEVIVLDNYKKPTERNRYIFIKNIDLKEGFDIGQVVFDKTRTYIKPSDIFPKSLVCILHSRHNGSIMV